MVVDAHGITIMPIQNVELTVIADMLTEFLKRYDLESVHVDATKDEDGGKPMLSVRTYDADGETCILSIFYDNEGGE